MKMKKFISGLLMFALLLGLIPAALAAGTPTVSISSGEVKAGESVTLTVSIEDNPGIAAAMIYIYFDTSVFEVDPKTDLCTCGVFQTAGGAMYNSIATAKENGRYNGDSGKDGIMALWYNSTGSNTNGNGEMMLIMLNAKEGAVNGNYAVEVGYSVASTINKDGEQVKLKTVGGTVTLSGGEDKEDSSDKEPSDKEPSDQSNPDGEAGSLVFPDAQGHWAQEYIELGADHGLMMGNELGMFMPDKTMTRAECVTVLWRACGSPKPTKEAEFIDLDPKQTWYHDAVAWASETGLVNGVGENKFNPLGTLNRDQIITLLFRMAGEQSGMESMFVGIYNDTFSDSGDIANWAKKAVYWSIYNDVICGVDSIEVGSQLMSTAPATRAQVAVMLVKYLDIN